MPSRSRAVAEQTVLRLDRQDPYLRILSATVFVRDQDRSLRFFVEQLGFTLVIDMSYESGDRWIAVAPPDGSTVLALISPAPNSKDSRRIGQSKNISFVTEDVVAKFHEWRQHGVRFHHPPQATLWGGISTRFDDPDGNTFSLVGGDDFVREIESQRRSAAEKLEAERRIAQELDIAKQVQARLFPQTVPALRTLDYDGICLQARAVGGDYYDFLNFGRDRVGIVICDISGKGIAAALLMANFQANLRSQSAVAADEPERFLQSVNQLFFANSVESAYATLFFAEYNDNTRGLRYANCGHYSGLLLRSSGKLERLDSTSTVLGLFPEWNCSIAERELAPGDTLALYTDGIIDALNKAGEEYGEDRLAAALKRHRKLETRQIIDTIADEVRRFGGDEQLDDITLIIAKGKNTR